MELPEIEAVSRSLAGRLRNQVLRNFTLKRQVLRGDTTSARLQELLVEKTVKDVSRHGRHLALHFDGEWVLTIYLSSGSEIFLGPADQTPGDKGTRLFMSETVLTIKGRGATRSVELVKKWELDEFAPARYNTLDPLSSVCSWPAFSLSLVNQRGRIKELLLKGIPVFGLGGIYSDEALFRAKISPGNMVKKISLNEMKELYHCIRDLTADAVEAYGALDLYLTASGKWEYPFTIYTYRRKGSACLKCKTKIKSLKVGDRITYYCPFCQK